MFIYERIFKFKSVYIKVYAAQKFGIRKIFKFLRESLLLIKAVFIQS